MGLKISTLKKDEGVFISSFSGYLDSETYMEGIDEYLDAYIARVNAKNT